MLHDCGSTDRQLFGELARSLRASRNALKHHKTRRHTEELEQVQGGIAAHVVVSVQANTFVKPRRPDLASVRTAKLRGGNFA
jgi:hypothetical protein